MKPGRLTPMSQRTRLIAVGGTILLLLLATSLLLWRGFLDNRDPGDGTATPGATGVADDPGFQLQVAAAPAVEGAGGAGSGGALQFRLSRGQEEPDAAEQLQVINGSPLDEETIQQIFERLPTVTPLSLIHI